MSISPSNESTEAFSVDLRLLLELGERLISKDEVAVVELVKNAYDADAKNCRVTIDSDAIVVADDGCGMDTEQVKSAWLALGTSSKKRSPTSLGGRRVLGEKGIGRLAVIRLGSRAEVLTRRQNGNTLRVSMDWQSAADKIAAGQPVPLADFKVSLEAYDGVFDKEHGTEIKITRVRHTWAATQIESLRNTLSRLVEPWTDEKPDFSISMNSNGEDLEVEPPEIIQNPHYRLRVQIDGDGRCSGKLGWRVGGKWLEDPLEDFQLWGEEGPPSELPGCGAFGLYVNAWDLDSTELRGFKLRLKSWSGVSLLRNGFRIVQPAVDWLGLGLRRVQNPTLRLSTNQVVGAISITSDGNPQLIDKTDREGLVENPAAGTLRELTGRALSILERKRFQERRRGRLSKRSILAPLDTHPLREIAKTLDEAPREAIETYADGLESFRGQLGEWVLGRDRYATMGMLSGRLVHEARTALVNITDNFPLIEPDLPDLGEPLRSRVTRLVDGGRAMSKVFARLDPFLKYRGRADRLINLEETLDDLVHLMGPAISRNEIKVTTSLGAGTAFKGNPTDWYIVISNLLDNSVYWLTHPKRDDRRIALRSLDIGEKVRLEFADTGPGVDPEDSELVFDWGYTHKENGSGIGLSIVKDVVESVGGAISVDSDHELKGACFRMELPVSKE